MPAATNHQTLSVHAHGVPNWIDLHTASINDAREFYEALLNWSYRNWLTLAPPPTEEAASRFGFAWRTRPPPTNGGLHLVGGKSAGGMVGTNRRKLVPASGTPGQTNMALALSPSGCPAAEIIERSASFDDMALLSNWVPYVYVDDLESTLALVEAAGGLVASPPARRGTMAMVATVLDPSDALLCLWQPLELAGAEMHHPGTLTWIELETPDLDAATKFYGEIFGWDAGEVSMGADFTGETYTVFTKNGERVAGAVQTAMLGLAASWFPSFMVPDVDEVAATCGRNGGVLMAEPFDIPVGRQAVLVDPGGAAFSILGPLIEGPRPL